MSKPKNAWDENAHDENKDEKKLTPDVSSLIVKIIEDDSNMLHQTLGISKKNSKRLQDLIYDQLRTDSDNGIAKSNTSTLLVKLSKACTHANELAFACFALGKITSEIGSPSGKGKRGASSMVRSVSIDRKTGKITHFDSEEGEDLPDFLKDILREILDKKKRRDDGDKD